jgi:hypothetical protein
MIVELLIIFVVGFTIGYILYDVIQFIKDKIRDK